MSQKDDKHPAELPTVAKEQHRKLAPAAIGAIPRPMPAADRAKMLLAEELLSLTKQDNQAMYDIRNWASGPDTGQDAPEALFVNHAFANAVAAAYRDAGYAVAASAGEDGRMALKVGVPAQLFKP